MVRPGSDVTGGLPWPPVARHNRGGAKPTNWDSELVVSPVLALLGKLLPSTGVENPPRDVSQKAGGANCPSGWNG